MNYDPFETNDPFACEPPFGTGCESLDEPQACEPKFDDYEDEYDDCDYYYDDEDDDEDEEFEEAPAEEELIAAQPNNDDDDDDSWLNMIWMLEALRQQEEGG